MLNIIDHDAIDSSSKLYNADNSGILTLDCLHYKPKKERPIQDISSNKTESLNTQEEKGEFIKSCAKKCIEAKNLLQKYTQNHCHELMLEAARTDGNIKMNNKLVTSYHQLGKAIVNELFSTNQYTK
eukprot:14103153-Ditylum_brightwellii.AAC.1